MAKLKRALIINEQARGLIAAAIERARKHALPLGDTMAMAMIDSPENATAVLTLADRAGKPNLRTMVEQVELFDGYQCGFSFEQQPHGMVRHLSVAVNNSGKVPMPAAVDMISREFGFREFPPEYGRVWVEEFRPGHYAVNVAELVDIPKPPTVQ